MVADGRELFEGPRLEDEIHTDLNVLEGQQSLMWQQGKGESGLKGSCEEVLGSGRAKVKRAGAYGSWVLCSHTVDFSSHAQGKTDKALV